MVRQPGVSADAVPCLVPRVAPDSSSNTLAVSVYGRLLGRVLVAGHTCPPCCWCM